MSYSIFVNYRRADAGPEAARVKEAIESEFGKSQVFLDVSSIEIGAEWPNEIEKKLKAADALVAVIGPEWLRAGSDKWGQRRIDDPSDWVRKELALALKTGKLVIPLLVGGASLPPTKALPASLRKLTERQALPIRTEFWDHDMKLLLGKLASAATDDCTSHDDIGPFPKSDLVPPRPLFDAELAKLIKIEIPLWEVKESLLPGKKRKQRKELVRSFKFEKFAEVIRFMNQVASGCDSANHHPRWENIFKTLQVHLSTWDGNLHTITETDVQLAKYFDWAFEDFTKLQESNQ